MVSSRLFWRIFTVQLLLVTVCVTALSATVLKGYRDLLESQFAGGLENTAELLTDYAEDLLRQQRLPHAQDAFFLLAARQQYQLDVFDEAGKLVTSTRPPHEQKQSTLHPRQIAASQQQTMVHIRGRIIDKKEHDLLLSRIGSEQENLGFLQLEAPRTELAEQIQQLSRLTWGVALFVCLLAALFSWLLALRITRPLEELTLAAHDIATGNLQQSVPVNSQDELGLLAQTFNGMSRELSRRIQELQEQEQQLRKNSERLATVLGGMVEGVIAVDSDDRILFANEAAFRMIEFDGHRVVGRPYWEVLRNSDVQTVVRDVVSGQYQLRREIDLARTQNRIAFIASRLPGNPCPGVVLVLHDVTELRRLEKIRSEFVSNVGHELKTPLAAIQACTETLLGGAIEEPVHAEHFLKQISEHADRLHKLIIDLMNLAKIESEEDIFELQVIDIGIPVQEAIDEHYLVAQTKKVALTYQATIEELPVLADLDAIRTIVNNLLDNALNYTPAGGKVHVEWSQAGEQVVVTVADSGIGIDRRHLERVFERFYRVDSARSRDAGGTGLGLAIVKHLCQLLGATISVTSEPKQGSTFTIHLPLHRSSP